MHLKRRKSKRVKAERTSTKTTREKLVNVICEIGVDFAHDFVAYLLHEQVKFDGHKFKRTNIKHFGRFLNRAKFSKLFSFS